MTVKEEADQSDYVDPTVTYVPLEPIENRMNDVNPERLAKYLDPKFINAKPDDKAIDSSQLEIQDEEKLDTLFDLDDTLEEEIEEENMKISMLAPREYQYALYEKALEENVITVLDTGAGKTLISVMLIKQMALEERKARLTRQETKLAFFLVERVPLVFQQASVIQANCDVQLESMCGEMEVDSWSEKKWRLIFEENDVCVMTAQIFLDALRHGFIGLDKVHLLIFDECHHATKKHPFNLIMREFYDRCPVEKRPKIFGMTASPMNARSSVEHSVTQLEKNLDARVYTAANLEELNITTNKPTEITLEYLPSPRYEETSLSKQIRDKVGSIPRYKRCFVVTADMLNSLGPWCSDYMWKIMLTDLERKMTRANNDLDRDSLIDEDMALKETHEFIDPIDFGRNPDVNDTNLFTPKVARLISVLNLVVNRLADFCGIIFVERRHTAVAIKTLIESLDSLSSARCGLLIGHGTADEGDIQMTFKDQNKTIEKFKTGEYNLLIATNVAEEGLDIQPCNVVIRFDFFHTLIAYIQSRGRARRKDSKYILLVEKGNASQQGMLSEFRALETDMKNFCQMLPEERNIANKYSIGLDVDYDSEDDFDSDEDDYMDSAIIIPETGATITKQNAVPLIHRYCNSLPSDSFCVLNPVFETVSTGEGYICKLHLPSNAAFQEMESPVVRSKDHAKALVALQACAQLRIMNALDTHLMPYNLRKEILGEMAPQYDENGFVIGSRRRHGLYEKRTPKLWARVSDVKEEEEVIEVEDNPDLLKAQAHHTPVAEEVHISKEEELTGTEAGVDDPFEIFGRVNGNGPIKIYQSVVDDEVPNGELDKESILPNGNSQSPLINLDETPEAISPSTDVTSEEKKVKENDNAETQAAEEEKKEEEEELGEGPFSCWFTILEVKLDGLKFQGIPLRRLCLISKKPFPSLPELKMFHKSVPFMVQTRNIETEIIFNREKIMALSEYMLKLLLALINKEFHCPVPDIPYFVVPLVTGCENVAFEEMSASALEELIDWKEIDSITQFTSQPFTVEDGKHALDSIVIDRSDNMRRYFIMNVRHDMNPLSAVPEGSHICESGYSTFADYYREAKSIEELDTNQPLLEVKRLKKVMNFLYPGQIVAAQVKGPITTYCLPSLCQRFFMSASVYQAMMMVPSIMTRIDSLLLCREAREKYDLTINDELMLEAYTTPSASMEMDYERLETLGDSLLKFIATIRLYINFPFSNEGELHHLRIRVICNRALYRSAKRLKFYRYITSQAFNRRYWRPPGFKSKVDNIETLSGLNYHKLSDKTLADIVEASLGAAYLSHGLEGGLHTAIQLQIPFDEIKAWDDFKPTFEESRKKVPARAEVRALRSLNLPKMEEIVGRQFQMPLLIVEALTHASLPNSTAPCYQRLEFLGDAILDFLVIRYLYSKYPDADPGTITDLKDSCVNNHVLGIICIEVGLYKHIIHYSGKLVRAIEQTVSEIDEAKQNGEAVGEYWRDFNIPKVLSDVVESMLGATFVDAGFRLEPVEVLFEKWFLPIFNNHVTPELIKIHPLRKFLTDLQRFGCDDFMLRNHSTGETGPKSQQCVIFLHGKPLAAGSDWNIKTARRFAAINAMQRLEDEPDLLESVCNCRVSMIKRGLLEEEKVEGEDEDEED
ncbi:MAG: dicer-2 protein [Benjaminiella poitrasii]|nr:MAG: dicer-2 protein [Benjaminiella poitrasii]